MIVLGIETSCDETAAAVVDQGGVRSNVIHSQQVHRPFGGVVPELASRDHLSKIVQVTRQALEEAKAGLGDIGAVAAASSPGLAGALLVGNSFGQGLALSIGKPFVAVNHIEAHVHGAMLGDGSLKPPFVALVVSGGHTSLFHVGNDLSLSLMGRTLDDAAGEAFDKVAKMLGLGYPGGPEIEKQAALAEPPWPGFPVASLGPESLDFSFSGLKTAVLNRLLAKGRDYLEKLEAGEIRRVSRGFQEAVIEAVSAKALKALEVSGCRALAVAGGVSVNRALRAELTTLAGRHGFKASFPPPGLCTDNAAMVAWNARALLLLDRARMPEPAVSARSAWPRYQRP